MAAMRTRGHLLWAALIFPGGAIVAQSLPGQVVQSLLPPQARIIESAEVPALPGRHRALLLWMLNPKRVLRDPKGFEYCGDSVYGDYWSGQTRFSLMDTSNRELLDTIKIVGSGARSADGFFLPFMVGNHYYHVAQPNAKMEGKPTLLFLRDLTGDGIAAEFVLFDYTACGTAGTSVFGYLQTLDRLRQYPVESFGDNGRESVELWVTEVFSVQPVSPGRWDFVWGPGHGVDDMVHERVVFDPQRYAFSRSTVVSHPEQPHR